MKMNGHKLYGYILSFAILFPLFRPRSIAQYDGLQKAFYLTQVTFSLALLFYIFVLLLKKRLKELSAISYLVILYKLWESFAIVMNGHADISTLVNAAAIVGATVFTEYMLKEAPLEYISALSFWSGLIVTINNLSYFSSRAGLVTDATRNPIYFWSTRNHLASLFFVALISCFLNNGMKRTKFSCFWNAIIILNVIWGTLVFQSATTIAGMAIYVLLLFAFKKKTVLYRPIVWYLGGIGLHIAIVILRVQEIFAYIIENLLHRNLTFSGRTAIWDVALKYLYNRPFLGYGQSSIFSFAYATSELPAHNQFLDIGIVCGVTGMLIFFVILFIVFSKLNRSRESIVGRTVCCALLSYIIMSIAESPNPYQPWFILFGIVAMMPELDRRYIYVSYKLNSHGEIKKRRLQRNM